MPSIARRVGWLACLACLVVCLTQLGTAPRLSAQRREPAPAGAERDDAEPMTVTGGGHTVHGDWQAQVTLDSSAWRPRQALRVRVALRFSSAHVESLASAGIKADRLCLLITAERTFDADGWMRLASDERMSTLLTPTGLAIEGGVQGASTNRYGYAFRSPVDRFVSLPLSSTEAADSPATRLGRFDVSADLPERLPPGLYRLRFDLGVQAGSRVYNLNGFTFASRPFSNEAGTSTYFYSPVIPASGIHASGRRVDASRIRPRCPWLLLSSYNSNGYRGVVADEDSDRFATSDRSLIPDEVILPMYSESGTTRLSYSLEPQFPADTIDALQNIAWNWASGEWSVRVAGPDGSVVDLGTSRFVAKAGNGPTTKAAALTAWRPQAYGRYTVTATGWIEDAQGRRYEGGGTYRFWIAKRMTLATATFQGMPYPVGSTYGRDIQFNPAVPADVQVTAQLFVGSDRRNVRSVTYSGKASPAGLFGAPQGMKPFALDAPGEYHARILATYTDAERHLWVCAMRHAGVVYAEGSPIVARGKKRLIGSSYVERGETKFEGYVGEDGEQHLDHLTFPYLSGDVLLIAAEGQGANKIEPVLTYQAQGDASPWDSRLNAVGTTNLRIETSNGYSPHLYPEYITDLEYYYAAAPRPGFMGRFIVGESNTRAPYWPVSPNSFGGQIGASPNGDAPGDIYRLIGGVVVRPVRQAAMYSGYIASAFILPKGTNNNRIVAPGAEDLCGPLGERARFFLVGLRPGTAYEMGSTFRPAVQIDPILPVSIHFVLTWPDGRRQVVDGTGDRFGSWAGPTAWPLDVPGVYRYQLTARWSGHEGRMPGLPDSGGEFFVYSKARPVGAAGLRIDGSSQRTFSASAGVTITGTTTAAGVRYTLITPGAVIDQGEIPAAGGRFSYTFDPSLVHARVPLYDVVSITTGKPQIGRVIHLTFFSQERAGGASFFDVARVILRGTTAITTSGAIPTLVEPVSPPVGATAAPPASRVEWIGAGSSELGRGLGADSRGASRASFATLRAADAEVDRLVRQRQLVVIAREDDPFVENRRHERLQQLHEGLPVVGGQVTRQLERGVAVSIFATLRRGIDVALVPRVPAEQARAAIERAADSPPRRPASPSPPSLVVLPVADDGYALAWRGVAADAAGRGREIFVSAETGERLFPDDRVVEVQAEFDAALEDPPGASAGTVGRAIDLAAVGGVEVRTALGASEERDRVRAAVGRAFARASAFLLPAGASFSVARAATIQSAVDLSGGESRVSRAVAEAWQALGVR